MRASVSVHPPENHLEAVHNVHGAGALVDIGAHAQVDELAHFLSALLGHPAHAQTLSDRMYLASCPIRSAKRF